jgi:septum site-determining protein MinC
MQMTPASTTASTVSSEHTPPSIEHEASLATADALLSQNGEAMAQGHHEPRLALEPMPLQIDVSTCADSAQAMAWLATQLPQWPGITAGKSLKIITGALLFSTEALHALASQVAHMGFSMYGIETLHPQVRHLARKLNLPVVAPLTGAVSSPLSDQTAKPLSAPAMSSSALTGMDTKVVTHNLRSGQAAVSAGHLLIIGDVNAGAEVTAVGDITVWGELKGIAHAGVEGNTKAEVRALRLDALQLRIAHAIARRPDHWVENTQADRLARNPEGLYQPEVARIEADEIRIFPYR